MSEGERDTSASDSSQESSGMEDIGEVLPIVDPYDGEPLASSSDEEGGARCEITRQMKMASCTRVCVILFQFDYLQ